MNLRAPGVYVFEAGDEEPPDAPTVERLTHDLTARGIAACGTPARQVDLVPMGTATCPYCRLRRPLP